MSTPAPWPTNSYGTSWRSDTIWFDCWDEAIIWQAIEVIDPLKVTARLPPIVVVGWESDGWLPVHDLVEIDQNGNDNYIVVDPRPDLHRTLSRIRINFGGGPWITVLGIARLDLADVSAYRALMAAPRTVGQRIGQRALHRILIGSVCGAGVRGSARGEQVEFTGQRNETAHEGQSE